MPNAEKDVPCDHGGNYLIGDEWRCLTCPHVWPAASDPEGYGDRARAIPPVEKGQPDA